MQIADQAGQTISAMIPEIKRTAELVQEISASSREQDTGAQQINQSILQLDQVIQQNASSAEESASMSEELAGQSEQMQETIAFFKLPDSQRNAVGKTTRRPDAPKPSAAAAGQQKKANAEPKPSLADQAARVGSKGIVLALDDDNPDGATRDDGHFQEF